MKYKKWCFLTSVMFFTDADEAALLKSRFKLAIVFSYTLLSAVMSSVPSLGFLLELLVGSFTSFSTVTDSLLLSLGVLLKFSWYYVNLVNIWHDVWAKTRHIIFYYFWTYFKVERIFQSEDDLDLKKYMSYL